MRVSAVRQGPLFAAALSLCGCVFNSAGLEKAPDLARADSVADVAQSREGTDTPPPLDRASEMPDTLTRPPDTVWLDQHPRDKISPDQGQPSPVSTSALGYAFANTPVPCVKADGSTQGSPVPVADSAVVAFYNGTVTLNGADQATTSWVGGEPSVIVVYNPNACDPIEDPAGYADWGTGGFLVRKASLQNGMLLLQPSVTIADLNAMNVNSDGTFQVDYFGPDDLGLSAFPQLVQPINKAKALILTLGL